MRSVKSVVLVEPSRHQRKSELDFHEVAQLDEYVVAVDHPDYPAGTRVWVGDEKRSVAVSLAGRQLLMFEATAVVAYEKVFIKRNDSSSPPKEVASCLPYHASHQLVRTAAEIATKDCVFWYSCAVCHKVMYNKYGARTVEASTPCPGHAEEGKTQDQTGASVRLIQDAVVQVTHQTDDVGFVVADEVLGVKSLDLHTQNSECLTCMGRPDLQPCKGCNPARI